MSITMMAENKKIGKKRFDLNDVRISVYRIASKKSGEILSIRFRNNLDNLLPEFLDIEKEDDKLYFVEGQHRVSQKMLNTYYEKEVADRFRNNSDTFNLEYDSSKNCYFIDLSKNLGDDTYIKNPAKKFGIQTGTQKEKLKNHEMDVIFNPMTKNVEIEKGSDNVKKKDKRIKLPWKRKYNLNDVRVSIGMNKGKRTLRFLFRNNTFMLLPEKFELKVESNIIYFVEGKLRVGKNCVLTINKCNNELYNLFHSFPSSFNLEYDSSKNCYFIDLSKNLGDDTFNKNPSNRFGVSFIEHKNSTKDEDMSEHPQTEINVEKESEEVSNDKVEEVKPVTEKPNISLEQVVLDYLSKEVVNRLLNERYKDAKTLIKAIKVLKK